MKIQKYFAYMIIAIIVLVLKPSPSYGLLDDVLDIFHIVKEVTVVILKAWDVVKLPMEQSHIDFPIFRKKHQKVLHELNEISKRINQAEAQHAEEVAMAVDTINDFIEGNLQLLRRRDNMVDTIVAISSRFNEMTQYEANKDKLENSTLLAFATWTVSPNTYSVNYLLQRLHFNIFGLEDSSRRNSNLFKLFLQNFEVIICKSN